MFCCGKAVEAFSLSLGFKSVDMSAGPEDGCFVQLGLFGLKKRLFLYTTRSTVYLVNPHLLFDDVTE